MSERTFMVDMEQQLSQDADGTYRDAVCQKLQDELAAIKKQVDAGLPPEDFDRANKVAEALQKAVGVVRLAWKLEHNKSQ